jgi:hypothetical protein
VGKYSMTAIAALAVQQALTTLLLVGAQVLFSIERAAAVGVGAATLRGHEPLQPRSYWPHDTPCVSCACPTTVQQ